MIKISDARIAGLAGFCLLVWAPPAQSTSWFELASKLSSDNNVYAYVTPYDDAYTTTELKFTLRDKLGRSTHYALNAGLANCDYNQLPEKDYLKIDLGSSLEEDLGETLVGTVAAQVYSFNYSDDGSSTYDYLYLTLTPGLRFYVFEWNFTSIDWGLQYTLYSLPNYNFQEVGWEPTLTFQEEVAEYHAFGTYLTIKQGLTDTLDLELTGKLNYQMCPERPLYTEVNDDFSNPTEYRHDLETTLSAGLMQRFDKNSYIKFSVCSSPLQSNANAQVWQPSGVFLEDDYYSRDKLRLILDAIYNYGQESSYLRFYGTYTTLGYASRSAQEETGVLLSEHRSDKEYSALLEVNQRLGYWLNVAWMLKLSYQYTQNMTNDYYYQYKREIISLGLNALLYL